MLSELSSVPYLDEISPAAISNDPLRALTRLLEAVAPDSVQYVFTGTRRCLRFLHICDYVLDQTFVCCVLCLSKWLRPENWADGVFEWPPPIPADALPAYHDAAEDGPLPLAAPVAVSDADISPRSRIGFPAMSSSGAL